MGLLVSLALGGCGGHDYPIAPVEGTITLDGEPLADAQVGFEPVRKEKQTTAGFGSYGQTDAQGHYRLESVHGDDGAVVGEHRVSISTMRFEEGPNGEIKVVAPERVPERYQSGDALTFVVPEEGTEEADFALTTEP
jgi:hypothetical protein